MIVANILINLIAAVGLLAAIGVLRRQPLTTPLERRLFWLLGFSVAMLVLRAVFWATDNAVMEALALIPAAFMPLLLLICTEGLLRRHAHFAMKLLVALGGVIVILFALIGHQRFEPHFSFAFAGLQCSVMVFCLGWIILRNRDQHTDADNRSANLFAIFIVFAAALFATDYPTVIASPARLGALGLLLGAYVIVFTTSASFSLRRTLIEFAAIAAIIAVFVMLAVVVLGADDWRNVFRLAAVMISMLLTTVIIVRYFSSFENQKGSLKERLASARTTSLDDFLEDALSTPATRGAIILSSADLNDYDASALKEAFHAAPVISRDALPQGVEAAEQVVDILDRHASSHAIMVSETPPSIILTTASTFSDARDFNAYLALLSRMARLIGAAQPEA
jgi:hypothetical protein